MSIPRWLFGRVLAVGLVAMLLVALVPALAGSAAAARSSKPKEIVVVGSKVKEASTERPTRVVFEIVVDRSLTETELAAVHDAVPDLLNELCDDPRAEQPCGADEMEAELQARVRDRLTSPEIEEVGVHVAARRDSGSAPVGIAWFALLGYGLLQLRRSLGSEDIRHRPQRGR